MRRTVGQLATLLASLAFVAAAVWAWGSAGVLSYPSDGQSCLVAPPGAQVALSLAGLAGSVLALVGARRYAQGVELGRSVVISLVLLALEVLGWTGILLVGCR